MGMSTSRGMLCIGYPVGPTEVMVVTTCGTNSPDEVDDCTDEVDVLMQLLILLLLLLVMHSLLYHYT